MKKPINNTTNTNCNPYITHISFAPLTLQKTITKEKHQKHLHHTTTQIFLKKKFTTQRTLNKQFLLKGHFLDILKIELIVERHNWKISTPMMTTRIP
jgi:hypothetical protein